MTRAPSNIKPSEAATSAWTRAKATLHDHLPLSAYQRWVEPTRVLGECGGEVCVGADPVAAEKLRTRVQSELSAVLARDSIFTGLRVYDI